MQQMFGLSYHCGNCDGLASHLKQGKCPTCGSTSVVPASWYQLSVEERSEWVERIQGRRTVVDRYRLDQPGIRPRVVLPPLQSCTAATARWAVMSPPREISPPNPLLAMWTTFCAWLSSLFATEQPALAEQPVSEPVLVQLEPIAVARMTGPVRPRVRATRPVVWSREHAPRTRVRVDRARTTRAAKISKAGPGPPRRKRLRFA